MMRCGFLSGRVEVTDRCQTDVSAQSLSDLLVNTEESPTVSMKSTIRSLVWLGDIMFQPTVTGVSKTTCVCFMNIYFTDMPFHHSVE